jgi:hypothetical protein
MCWVKISDRLPEEKEVVYLRGYDWCPFIIKGYRLNFKKPELKKGKKWRWMFISKHGNDYACLKTTLDIEEWQPLKTNKTDKDKQ